MTYKKLPPSGIGLATFLVASTFSLSSLAQLPAVPVPAENPITEEKRILGKILFWDEQLSIDNSIACGSCHAPTAGGADTRIGNHPGPDGAFNTADDIVGSPGVVKRDSSGTAIDDPTFGFDPQVTGRLAPNFFGALWSDTQFWDGRAEGPFIDPLDGTTVAAANNASLEIQSIGPILNTVEMAKDGRTWTEVTDKLAAATPLEFADDIPQDMADALQNGESYSDLFNAAFGTPEITPVRIGFAIATYERTLVADQTPFDLGTLTTAQQNGQNAMAASGCLVCHAGQTFTDNTFRNIGVRPPDEDLGRQDISNNAADRGTFKVPTLRNTGLKERFMHNGSLTNLNAVIAFYAPGGQNSNDNLDPLVPAPVPPNAIADVVDFIENGLTDPRVADGVFPFDAPTLTAAGVGIEEEIVPFPYPMLMLLASGLALIVHHRRPVI